LNSLIVITGPTGVGKTELCLNLAQHYGIDIINADSRQIYAEIPIGTAAPTAEQMQEVKHYFVGTKHIDEYYSASMFEQDVLRLIAEKEREQDKNPIAIMTGGSMMYIDAVCNGIDNIPTISEDVRNEMKQRLETEGLEVLVEELKRLDPQHWAIVDKNNPRRVVHALEICHQTGRSYTSYRIGERKKRPFNIIKVGLTVDKVAKVKRGQVIMDHNELYERINKRVLSMVEHGLEEEVRKMLPFRQEKALNTIGYKEMFQYLDGNIPIDETIRQIQSNSREYARKQLTWFKKDTEITWFRPEQKTEIINFIDKKLL
jgi:tRNA dimethylallyltransferase